MRDGRTRKSVQSQVGRTPFAEFSNSYSASLVVLTGDLQGTDYPIERPTTVLGRGPGADLSFSCETLSRQHASVEFADGGLRLRDLGSLNGITLNGSLVEQADLDHGDKFRIGDLVLQLIVEPRSRVPKTHYIADD
ncbi:MAG: FHA domain-containing protein [Myxococcota bacterium]